FNKINLITCHLGGGSSVTAIKKGKAIDTSMGFTPLEGVTMMTRPGNIDPGILLELFKYYNYDTINKVLNYESGLKALSGHEKMLDILKDKKAEKALQFYIYQIQKYIGAYLTILKECQAIVYTGTIGYGSSKIRRMINKNFKLKSLAIEPNEELAIAEKICKKY
ncbi:MAG: acetate kinase, partial [Candidatus Pacebacteria bacterium]|nr:acetate kinase [Candidatus Paceibacterota bacterium]